jgi:hypothetical protein
MGRAQGSDSRLPPSQTSWCWQKEEALTLGGVTVIGQCARRPDPGPHADSTCLRSRQTPEKSIAGAGLNEREAWQFVRGSAIACYGIQFRDGCE